MKYIVQAILFQHLHCGLMKNVKFLTGENYPVIVYVNPDEQSTLNEISVNMPRNKPTTMQRNDRLTLNAYTSQYEGVPKTCIFAHVDSTVIFHLYFNISQYNSVFTLTLKQVTLPQNYMLVRIFRNPLCNFQFYSPTISHNRCVKLETQRTTPPRSFVCRSKRRLATDTELAKSRLRAFVRRHYAGDWRSIKRR